MSSQDVSECFLRAALFVLQCKLFQVILVLERDRNAGIFPGYGIFLALAGALFHCLNHILLFFSFHGRCLTGCLMRIIDTSYTSIMAPESVIRYSVPAIRTPLTGPEIPNLISRPPRFGPGMNVG